jgi:hypothetical protein
MRLKILFVSVFLLFTWSYVSAQFIRFQLTLPPGVDVKVDPIPPQVIEPNRDGSSQIGTNSQNKGHFWVEFRSQENIDLLISTRIEYRFGSSGATFYWLNDGSTRFAEAKELKVGTNHVKVYHESKLMKQMPDETLHFSAWLGVPANRSGVITIEFL